MSTVLTSLTVSKRKLMTLFAAAGAAAAGALSLPTAALAARKKPKVKGRKSKSEAGKFVASAPNLGLMILVDFEGNIDAYPIDKDAAPGGAPPPDDKILGDGDIAIKVFQENPKCIWCSHGGNNIKVCK